METAAIIAQFVIALGIVNVWILRFGKRTNWRGGDAGNMKEEFAVYGLPEWSLGVVGGLKLFFAFLLIVGIWFPAVTKPAVLGIGVLMLGAVAMHFKAKDQVSKSIPAFTMFALCLFVVAS
jgi:hypothetical protein